MGGRAAVVTGAGRGLGRAVALALGGTGRSVAVVARTRAELDETVEAVRTLGGVASAHIADVTDPAAVDSAAAAIESLHGRVDLLVNNAGTMAALGPPWEVDERTWWRDVETSLRGAFLWSRAVCPGMLASGGGRVVNVVSTVATRPSPYASGYAAGKAGLISFTEALASSGREHGLRAFGVAPGFVETAMTARLGEPDARRWFPDAGAGGAVEPERLGLLVAYLASGAADALSGRVLHVLDDVPELVRRADEVVRADAYAPRLQRLSLDQPS